MIDEVSLEGLRKVSLLGDRLYGIITKQARFYDKISEQLNYNEDLYFTQ
jgi:hypothetical protein